MPIAASSSATPPSADDQRHHESLVASDAACTSAMLSILRDRQQRIDRRRSTGGGRRRPARPGPDGPDDPRRREPGVDQLEEASRSPASPARRRPAGATSGPRRRRGRRGRTRVADNADDRRAPRRRAMCRPITRLLLVVAVDELLVDDRDGSAPARSASVKSRPSRTGSRSASKIAGRDVADVRRSPCPAAGCRRRAAGSQVEQPRVRQAERHARRLDARNCADAARASPRTGD